MIMIWYDQKLKNRFVNFKMWIIFGFFKLIFWREHNVQKKKPFLSLTFRFMTRVLFWCVVVSDFLISCLLHILSIWILKMDQSVCSECKGNLLLWLMTVTLMPNDKKWYFISLEIFIFLEHFSALSSVPCAVISSWNWIAR